MKGHVKLGIGAALGASGFLGLQYAFRKKIKAHADFHKETSKNSSIEDVNLSEWKRNESLNNAETIKKLSGVGIFIGAWTVFRQLTNIYDN